MPDIGHREIDQVTEELAAKRKSKETVHSELLQKFYVLVEGFAVTQDLGLKEDDELQFTKYLAHHLGSRALASDKGTLKDLNTRAYQLAKKQAHMPQALRTSNAAINHQLDYNEAMYRSAGLFAEFLFPDTQGGISPLPTVATLQNPNSGSQMFVNYFEDGLPYPFEVRQAKYEAFKNVDPSKTGQSFTAFKEKIATHRQAIKQAYPPKP